MGVTVICTAPATMMSAQGGLGQVANNATPSNTAVPSHDDLPRGPYGEPRAAEPRRIHHNTAAWIGSTDTSASANPIDVPNGTTLTLST